MLKVHKKWLSIMMLTAVPLAYSDPISLVQEAPVRSATAAPSLKKIEVRPIKKVVKIPLPRQSKPKTVTGIASWYSETDPGINLHTANGEIFDDSKLTCASWDHPFGTMLRVQNLSNGKSVLCRVNDRGPHKRLKRLVDLTKTAFGRIANPGRGLVRVSVTKVSGPGKY